MRMGETAIVKSIDPAKKLVHFSTGKTVKYEHLVSTMALDGLLDRLDAPKETVEPLQKAAEGLVFSSTIVLGVGIRGVRPDRIGDKCKSISIGIFTGETDCQAGYTFQRTTPPSIERQSSPTTPITTPLSHLRNYQLNVEPRPKQRSRLHLKRDRTGVSCSKSASRSKEKSTWRHFWRRLSKEPSLLSY